MSQSQFFLVDLSIATEDCDKSLAGVFESYTESGAKYQAIYGECHNIDHDDDEDEEKWSNSISECAEDDDDIEDDVFTYSVNSCHALQITETTLDNKIIKLAVLPIAKRHDNEETTVEETVIQSETDEKPFLTEVKWMVEGYEKNLNPIVWAVDKQEAMKLSLLAESENLPDEDDEDYDEIRAKLLQEIENSNDISVCENSGLHLAEWSGLYVAEWAEQLQSVDFILDGNAYTGMIDPTEENQPVLVYMPRLK